MTTQQPATNESAAILRRLADNFETSDIVTMTDEEVKDDFSTIASVLRRVADNEEDNRRTIEVLTTRHTKSQRRWKELFNRLWDSTTDSRKAVH